MMSQTILPSLPSSWSSLTWQQLCALWEAKMRYGGDPDVARAAACLALLGLSHEPDNNHGPNDPVTGETIYMLRDKNGGAWTTTARSLSYIAKKALPWFDYPYGDNGDKEEKDENGKVTKERREGVRGYVNEVADWRDAMSLSEEMVTVCNTFHFALPQVACNNITWHQYRTLQALVPQLFQDGVTDELALDLQARFLAFITVPETIGGNDNDDHFRPAHSFKYDAERAEASVPFWRDQLAQGTPLFHICFQVYHTAVTNFYPSVYPILFGGSTKSDPMHSVLSSETDTITAIMEEGNYTDPQQVYDTNLPIILSVLNRMSRKAKEIEEMNKKIKKK